MHILPSTKPPASATSKPPFAGLSVRGTLGQYAEALDGQPIEEREKERVRGCDVRAVRRERGVWCSGKKEARERLWCWQERGGNPEETNVRN